MANTTNFNWETPDDTDLVKDGAAAIRTLGNSIDTSFVDLKGGTTGQVLAKASNTDLDFTWASDATGIPATIFDAKGDLIAASAADTAARLAVGTNGHVLTADSTTATGLNWAAPAAGGKVLQVVNATTSTTVTSSTSTFVDTNLTATITPSATTSKILVLVSQSGMAAQADRGAGLRLLRGATTLLTNDYAIETTNLTAGPIGASVSLCYLDSPSTTSATTYKTQLASSSNQASVNAQRNGQTSMITLLEIGA